MADSVEVMVDGGKASAGPPLGPALGPLGINIGQVIKLINEKTKNFAGMKVPVKVTVQSDKSFDVTVGTPPTSALVIKELGVEKGSGKPNTDKVGNLKIEQVIKIAKMKEDALTGKTLKNRCLEVIGTCCTMGVNIEGMNTKEATAAIKEGKYDGKFK
jgi:large subunit ribosomal protein L11